MILRHHFCVLIKTFKNDVFVMRDSATEQKKTTKKKKKKKKKTVKRNFII